METSREEIRDRQTLTDNICRCQEDERNEGTEGKSQKGQNTEINWIGWWDEHKQT